MTVARAKPLTLSIANAAPVSALWQCPSDPVALYVYAHGAGAGMNHPFMAATADELAQLGIATLRYQFPYMEKGGKRPDPPELCHAAVRSAVEAACALAPTVPAFAGGKSFGGRMTSQAQAHSPLAGVQGLIFLGFPLHPPKQPSDARGEHLDRIRIPMLFLQGSRDEFADRSLLLPLIERLGDRATLRSFEGADHSFHVPARSGRNDVEIRTQVLEGLAGWTREVSAIHGS